MEREYAKGLRRLVTRWKDKKIRIRIKPQMLLPFPDIYIDICFPDLSRANARRRKLQRQLASGKTRIILVATFT